MHNMEVMMRRGFGVGLSLICGLAFLLFNSFAALGADAGSPYVQLSGTTPIHNGAIVILSGGNFAPGEILPGFGVVVRRDIEATGEEESPCQYRGYNLPEMQITADDKGEFRQEIPLSMLSGVSGHLQIVMLYHGRLIGSEFAPVKDTGVYRPDETDATAGALRFGTYSKGGPGEPIIANGDDVPLTSYNQSNWAGTLFQVNQERYTTTDGTGTSTPYNNITNDVGFTAPTAANLTTSSSGVVAGISATYKSIRMTVLVWDDGNYASIVGTTTTGTTQGQGWLSCADITPPSLSSASATSLTTITVTFTESVTTPADSASAINNWSVNFGGNKAVSALSPLGSSGTTTITLTVADLGDRGATPAVYFTGGTNEFEDASGNDCEDSDVIATDGIAPATPSLTAPTDNTKMEGASVAWTASAGAGTDGSLTGLKFQGSDNGSTWADLGTDIGSPYGGTYTFGTKYIYYRAQAYDASSNTANSSSTANLQDAHHLHLTTIPVSTQANIVSGQWTFTVHDNYGNAENVTQTVALSTSSASGVFRATPSGSPITYVSLTNNSAGNFYYLDTHSGTFWIYVINVALVDDSTQYTVLDNTTVASITIRTAASGGGSATSTIEIAGAANGGSYNVTPWMYAAGYNSLGQYVQDMAATWSLTGTLPSGGGSGFENAGAAASNRYTAVSGSNASGYIVATYNGFTDSTGTVTVDATKPATVQSFNITEDQDHFYVNASWSPSSSYDDGSSAGSGNVGDFDVRFSAVKCSTEALWLAATTVGSSGKPTSFNGSSSWRIYMAPFPSGNYFYAIKTMDPQGNWSNMGSGCFTTQSDFSLPVTLSSFTASGGYGKINLHWSTESEVDALGFRLLRANAEDFANSSIIASYEDNPELLCQGTSETGFDYTWVDQENLQPETIYYYRLESVDVNGRMETCSLEASAAPLAPPTEYALGPNFPNPFNPETQFEIQLPEDGNVTITVYDIHGREVTRIRDNAYMEAGVHQLSWNGRDGNGNGMPSGIYFCRLQSQAAPKILKMMLIK